ncbi:MAG: hypothetical protein ACRDD2_14245 [Sarcina sp.]
MENKKVLPISIIILSLSIILGSFIITNSIKKSTNSPITNNTIEKTVFNLSEVANYMNISEKDVEGIIYSERKILNQTSTFSGTMFPYFIINEKKYFYKDEIDNWLKEATIEHRNYDTTNNQLSK